MATLSRCTPQLRRRTRASPDTFARLSEKPGRRGFEAVRKVCRPPFSRHKGWGMNLPVSRKPAGALRSGEIHDDAMRVVRETQLEFRLRVESHEVGACAFKQQAERDLSEKITLGRVPVLIGVQLW